MDNFLTVTEQQIVDTWERWGNGTPLKPGFAKWLAAELSKPIEFPSVPPPPLKPDSELSTGFYYYMQMKCGGLS